MCATGLPANRRRRESLPIVANGVYGARDIDTIAPLSSPKANDGAWARAEPTPELPPPKKRRGLFGHKSSGEFLHGMESAHMQRTNARRKQSTMHVESNCTATHVPRQGLVWPP